MDLPIFIGNTYCLFVAKVLDLNVSIEFLEKYVIISLIEDAPLFLDLKNPSPTPRKYLKRISRTLKRR